VKSSLVWVLVDGAPRHVSEFAAESPRRRPLTRCPQCGRRLYLKLGRVRRHHAAHAPGDTCPATRPETALHLDCKLAIAAVLRATAAADRVLSIEQRCLGVADEPCDERRSSVWVRNWNAVSIEQRAGDASPLRPDITLLRAGEPVGAIEVVVTNAVSPEKEIMLAAIGVSWIEVIATEALAEPGGWTIDVPLRIARHSREPVWRCRAHAARHRMLAADADARRAAEREAERVASVLRAARVVDLYHTAGRRERFIYRVNELLVDGALTAICLHRGGIEVARIEVDSPNDARDRGWPGLRVAFSDDLARFARDPDSFADSPMRWARGDAAENIVGESLTDFVGRDATPLATRFPRRWFYAPEQDRWFLPADMRDVRWDRGPLDAFAAHPAWTRHHRVVRERPEPEGSWTTPVFASPPIAALFHSGTASVESYADGAIAVVHVPGAATAKRPRVIAVIERPVDDAAVESVARHFDANSIDAVWLSSPRHWTPALARLVWAPAGRDWSGRGGVVIDGLGVFRADRFAAALARANSGLSGEAIRARMSARVERFLRQRLANDDTEGQAVRPG
jgi:hypothetical protein